MVLAKIQDFRNDLRFSIFLDIGSSAKELGTKTALPGLNLISHFEPAGKQSGLSGSLKSWITKQNILLTVVKIRKSLGS